MQMCSIAQSIRVTHRHSHNRDRQVRFLGEGRATIRTRFTYYSGHKYLIILINYLNIPTLGDQYFRPL
jgi:hypothetical protein